MGRIPLGGQDPDDGEIQRTACLGRDGGVGGRATGADRAEAAPIGPSLANSGVLFAARTHGAYRLEFGCGEGESRACPHIAFGERTS